MSTRTRLHERPGPRRPLVGLILVGFAAAATIALLRYRRAAFDRNAVAFHERYDEPNLAADETSH